MFDADGQVRWSPFNTDGILGDRYTVNRKIQPYFKVERRKYRFRILNGGPSRFYQLSSTHAARAASWSSPATATSCRSPIEAESLYLRSPSGWTSSSTSREYRPGDTVDLVNRLEQTNGKGPSGRMLDPGDRVIQFRVVEATARTRAASPTGCASCRASIPARSARERAWEFDYDGGLWTINGKVFDPNRIDAGIEQGTAEIWIFRNGGNTWSHPIHSHFTEFLILEVNGRPFDRELAAGLSARRERGLRRRRVRRRQAARRSERFMGGKRRDVATLLPGDEIKVSCAGTTSSASTSCTATTWCTRTTR